MLLEHAAEVIAIREAAVLGDLFDGFVGVAQAAAGLVEAEVEEKEPAEA